MAKLYFRYGAMNCGKSTHLLQVAHNYEETGHNVIVLKPLVDTKGGDKVVSRLGAERQVDYLIKDEDNILDVISDCDFANVSCILVDEAQFLTKEHVDSLYYITKTIGIPVICYGLRCDFQMIGFRGSPRLLELADSIEEMKTICKCGNKATHNMRLINNIPTFSGEQVVIDDGMSEATYEAVCGECYILKKIW